MNSHFFLVWILRRYTIVNPSYTFAHHHVWAISTFHLIRLYSCINAILVLILFLLELLFVNDLLFQFFLIPHLIFPSLFNNVWFFPSDSTAHICLSLFRIIYRWLIRFYRWIIPLESIKLIILELYGSFTVSNDVSVFISKWITCSSFALSPREIWFIWLIFIVFLSV